MSESLPPTDATAAADLCYTDYAKEEEPGQKVLRDSFPVKLHYMLADVEKDGLDDIVSWHVHGRCFSVRRPGQFVNSILPNYFRQSKLPSFHRQLNLYGFQRIKSGPDKGAYFHELFLRGKPFLANRIDRYKVKSGMPDTNKPAPSTTEPNLYSYEYLPASDMSKYQMPGSSDNCNGKEKEEAPAVASTPATPLRTPHLLSPSLVTTSGSGRAGLSSLMEETSKKRASLLAPTIPPVTCLDATKLSAARYLASAATRMAATPSSPPQSSLLALTNPPSVYGGLPHFALERAMTERLMYSQSDRSVLTALLSPRSELARRHQALMASGGMPRSAHNNFANTMVALPPLNIHPRPRNISSFFNGI